VQQFFDTLQTVPTHPIRFGENSIAVNMWTAGGNKFGKYNLIVVGTFNQEGDNISWTNVLETPSGDILMGLVDYGAMCTKKGQLLAIFENPEKGMYVATASP